MAEQTLTRVNPLDSEFSAPKTETPAALAVPDDLSGETTQKVTREVDFGDGAGKRTFEAATADELLDLLTAEQTKAADKIRTQASRRKPDQTAPDIGFKLDDPKDFTADELFALGQEIQKNPATALDKILQAQTGMTAKQLREIGEDHVTSRQQRIATQAENAFLAAHSEDYKPSQANAKAITTFLAAEKLPYTAANLEYAFQELSESGKLDKPDAGKVEVPAHTRTKPLSSGLSRKSGTALAAVETTTTANNEAEDAKFRAMSQDERRRYLFAKRYAQK